MEARAVHDDAIDEDGRSADQSRGDRFQYDPSNEPEYKPLEAYGMIGDSRTAVLVGADGSVDWACMPDFDSPSVFGALLDPSAGRFAIRPRDPYTAWQRYERGTNVLVTEMSTARGTVRIRDFMPYTHRKVPTAEIYRRIEAVRGKVDLEVIFEPRFEYGQYEPELVITDNGVKATHESGQSLVLSSELPMRRVGASARGEATLEAGHELYLVSDWGAVNVHRVTSYQCDRRLWQVRTFWRSWVDRLTYHGRYRDAVERSLLALKLLIYEPTGAIVAAPTTSLPEWHGGGRNWDYRYTWVRDSAFILRALFHAQYMEEGTAYFDWLLGQALEGGPLQVM
ncbi:MAG TPA: trehalase-like domain-containing protein, partial [Rhodothermales bacterium]